MDVAILLIVLEISKISSATKAWRLQVSDAFNDARFFRVRLQEALLWKPLICALMDSDRERFAELLGVFASQIKMPPHLETASTLRSPPKG